jgi:hypothetical protein
MVLSFTALFYRYLDAKDEPLNKVVKVMEEIDPVESGPVTDVIGTG